MEIKIMSMLQAFHERRNGAISWDQYIRIHLLRVTGVKSNEDNAENAYSELRKADPFGHMMEVWIDWLVTRLGLIDDIRPFEDVFKAYQHGTLGDVKEKLVSMQQLSTVALEGAKQTLAMLACQERRADVLEYCLDESGFDVEDSFLEEAANVDAAADPETYSVIANSSRIQLIWEVERSGNECRMWRPSKHERDKRGQLSGPDEQGTWAGHRCGAPLGVEADFNVGGSHPVRW